MLIQSFNINSVKKTQIIASSLYQVSMLGDMFALYGDIGVGKTTFIKYFINQAINKVNVTSPSYNLYFKYNSSKAPIYHMDAWRLECENEILNLGIHDYFQEAIFLIEWAEKVESFLPTNKLKINMNYKNNLRSISFYGNETWKKRLRKKFSRDFIEKSLR